MIDPWVIAAGASVGAGVAVLIRALVPDVPDLAAALARLDTADPEPVAVVGASRWHRTSTSVFTDLGARLHLDRYARDLALLGETPATLAARKTGYALLGLAFPPVLLAAVALLGIVPPIVVPAAVSLLLAAVLFWVPDADLRRRAQTERDAMRLAVCAYLEFVALERAGDAGTVQALERAAWVADAPGFVRIRDALTRAELAGRPPWDALGDLSEQVGVPELGDLADIMRLSGTDGAAVYATLRARAASLRHQLLAASAAEANAASEHMIIPVALLGIAFMALIGYPAFARILFS
ncbi:type II secretion system F family protein [Longivirga aurantiaca]|uniref:Type II secretion system F family protein n=1 Tax=Longivirga aurantiaca TaxID=1837743 RepID=A0ABW1T4J6_9ACTN